LSLAADAAAATAAAAALALAAPTLAQQAGSKGCALGAHGL
jgi:hypothetical protein